MNPQTSTDRPTEGKQKIPIPWIELAITWLVLLLTPLNRLWPIVLVTAGALVFLKQISASRGLLWGIVAITGGILGTVFSEQGKTSAPITMAARSGETSATNIQRLEIHGLNGSITIRSGSENTIRWQARTRGGARLETAMRNGIFVIEIRHPTFDFSAGADIEIQAPLTNRALEIESSNGPIEVIGPVWTVHAETSNGPITVRDAQSNRQPTADEPRIDLSTSNGDLTLERFAGSAHLSTDNGSVRVTQGVDTELEIETSNGRIVLQDVELRADSENSAQTSNSEIEASNLRSQGGFKIQGSASNSRFEVVLPEFSVELHDDHFTALKSGNKLAKLELETSNGAITVRR